MLVLFGFTHYECAAFYNKSLKKLFLNIWTISIFLFVVIVKIVLPPLKKQRIFFRFWNLLQMNVLLEKTCLTRLNQNRNPNNEIPFLLWFDPICIKYLTILNHRKNRHHYSLTLKTVFVSFSLNTFQLKTEFWFTARKIIHIFIDRFVFCVFRLYFYFSLEKLPTMRLGSDFHKKEIHLRARWISLHFLFIFFPIPFFILFLFRNEILIYLFLWRKKQFLFSFI